MCREVRDERGGYLGLLHLREMEEEKEGKHKGRHVWARTCTEM
jgi:hypothetical protein